MGATTLPGIGTPTPTTPANATTSTPLQPQGQPLGVGAGGANNPQSALAGRSSLDMLTCTEILSIPSSAESLVAHHAAVCPCVSTCAPHAWAVRPVRVLSSGV